MTQSLQQPNNKDKLYFQDLWKSVKNDLILHYGEAIFRSWFSKMCVLDCNENYITLSVPTNFMRDWIKANYFDSIQRLWSCYDNSIKYIDIVTVAESNNNDTTETILPSESSNSTKSTLSITHGNNSVIFSSALDPRLTFNNFVVGRPNELAYAAARAVAESNAVLGETNPLFLYGGVGLGKTHLMHAIAWHIQACNSQRKVIYMSAEKFMYQFVQSLRNKDVMSFKERFRSVDILMIDDIQFICGKDSTQEEFFHTFNTLIDNKRQIVISCDRSPSDLDNVEERIKSRLGWGLVADVHSTTYELRLGILQSKIEQLNVYVPLNVLEFLANKITSNVRELEGALNKVIAHSTLVGLEITLENTQDILRDLLRSTQKNITIETIQKKVARHYNVGITDMLSQRKSRDVARPRQLAMYLAKRLTSHSLVDIGKTFNKKDHTTVIHAIKAVEELIKSDNNFNNEINSLMQMLQA